VVDKEVDGDSSLPARMEANPSRRISSYVYLPKLRDHVVLQESIRDAGAKSPPEIMAPSEVRAAEALEQLKQDAAGIGATGAGAATSPVAIV
jgi:hypothetical protein